MRRFVGARRGWNEKWVKGEDVVLEERGGGGIRKWRKEQIDEERGKTF